MLQMLSAVWCCFLFITVLGDLCDEKFQRQHTCVTNYVDQQTLKPDDDYVLPRERLWMFNVLVCLPSATERFLLQPLTCPSHVTAAPSLLLS